MPKDIYVTRSQFSNGMGVTLLMMGLGSLNGWDQYLFGWGLSLVGMLAMIGSLFERWKERRGK